MNRREMCSRLLPGLLLVRVSMSGQAGKDAGSDDYAIWSDLIPRIQYDPGAKYLVAANTASPDGLPRLRVGPPKPAIEKARESSRQGEAVSYESALAEPLKAAFSEALSSASLSPNHARLDQQRIHIKKPLRLLSDGQVRAFLDLSPPVVDVDWRPNAAVTREFNGCKQVSSISVPFYDSRRQLALVWARTGPSCWSSYWSLYTKEGGRWRRQAWDSERHELCT